MTTQLTATVVKGMLKPETRLPLAEPIDEKSEGAAAWEALKARLRERPIRGSGERFSGDELYERKAAR